MRRNVWMLCMLAGLASVAFAADPPALINYQGVLRDAADKPVADGSYNMVFRFYSDAGPGGDAIAVDTQTVGVTGGVFNVRLGLGLADGPGPGIYPSLTKVLANHANLYLEVEVGGETLIPRIPLASAGYALNARTLRGVEVVSPGPLALYVNGATGDDENDGLSPAHAKRTIQGAVDAIPPILGGDVTVSIADGVYHERVAVLGSSRYMIHLIGNTTFPGNVAIDGTGLLPGGRADMAILVGGQLVEIAGITVQNFEVATSETDFGVVVQTSGSLELHDCRIVNNDVREGALIAIRGRLEVSSCLISNNSWGVVAWDHGIVEMGKDVEVSGNTVRGAYAARGARITFSPPGPNLCTITNNDMVPADHSTISGYSRCVVTNSPCTPTAGDPTARCVPY